MFVTRLQGVRAEVEGEAVGWIILMEAAGRLCSTNCQEAGYGSLGRETSAKILFPAQGTDKTIEKSALPRTRNEVRAVIGRCYATRSKNLV